MTTLAGLISGPAKLSLDTAQAFDTVKHIYGLCAGAGVAVPSEILAAIHQDDDAHDTCTLTACLNPLHPGPCKGWKHNLFQTAPNAWHALEAARVEKANKRRLEKIEALKAAGKPIPKKLLVPIVAKPHPHPGQTAKAATGEAHAAGEAVSKAAGVHVNAPGKVMLGQATKTLGQTVEKGPKGKKPTLASKGIAFVIAQEKVTPQYKLDKAAAITPEQWAALSHDDKAVIRGELLKIQKDGFGPQQKKATELLDKLAEAKTEPKIGELKPGTPGTITAPSGKVYQKINLPTPEAKTESKLSDSVKKAAREAHAAKIENKPEKAAVLAPHVQHAIDMATGVAPGASWSKNHLAAYQHLTADDFKSLNTDVQSKILGELEKGKGKFLDPKKVKASDDLIAKFKGATGKIDHGIEAPKPPVAVKADDMTPAQVTSKASDLLGPEAVKPHVKPNFAEFQANMTKAKKDAKEEFDSYGSDLVNTPEIAAKKLALEKAFTDLHNAETTQSKLLAHVSQHHMAVTNSGKSIAGEPLSAEDTKIIGKHALKLAEDLQIGHQVKQAKDALDQAKEALHNTVKASKLAHQAPAAAPKVELSEFDQKTVKNAFSNAWGKHASKAVTFGVKYQHSQKMKANPEYEKLTQDLGNLKSLAGQVALAHAEENAAKLNAPLHADTGVIEPGTPEAKVYAAAISKRSQLEQEFNALHKLAQARLDTIRTEAGLKKRTLPKLDTAAVKAAAAESGYYQSAGYGGPNYGKHASAKSYMLAKVGDNLGVKHQTASEKANEKAAAQIAKMSEDVKKSGGSVSPTGKYVPPPTTQKTKDQFPSATEAGTTPSLESAQKYGFHYEQKYAPPVHGWPGDTGGAYVTANSEHLEAAKKILSSPDLKTGLEAQTQFKWSINNMDGKGAPAGSKGSLYNYTGSGYDAVNSKLNSLPPGAKKTGSTSISNIDKGMEASPAPEQDLILYRGFKDPHGVFSSGKWNDVNVAGMEWSQRSYSSTSGNLSTAQSFAGYGGVVMRVIVPKEMQVKGINAKGGQHPGEAEIILQRGLRYRVVADHGKHGSQRYIDVMVVPNPYAQAE